MQSNFIYEINEKGEVLNIRVSNEEQDLQKNETDKPIPDGFFKPLFNMRGKSWYEGASKEELDEVAAILNAVEIPKTAEEEIKELKEKVRMLEIAERVSKERANMAEAALLEIADLALGEKEEESYVNYEQEL